MLAPDDLLQGRYRVAKKLGHGGMGTVYKAQDERLAIEVALKECQLQQPEFRKHFTREAKILARLRHPALARVIDYFEERDLQYLVMDFVDGPDLAELLRWDPQTCHPQNVISWADRLLDALEFLHSQSPPIIHRDIKPANLKLSIDGGVVLLDFGLAKSAAPASKMTLSGSIFGYTPHYAPIEQIQGAGTDVRSDVYALGATVHHLLTREIPPDALARVTATTDGLSDPLQLASELNPDVSVHVAKVLQKAMAIGRSGRFTTASEMRQALREARFSNAAAAVADASAVDAESPAEILAFSEMPSSDRPAVSTEIVPAHSSEIPAPIFLDAVPAPSNVPDEQSDVPDEDLAVSDVPLQPAATPRSRFTRALRRAAAVLAIAIVVLAVSAGAWFFTRPVYISDLCTTRIHLPAADKIVAISCQPGAADDVMWLSTDKGVTWSATPFPDRPLQRMDMFYDSSWGWEDVGAQRGSNLIARAATDLFSFDYGKKAWSRLNFSPGASAARQVTSVANRPFVVTDAGLYTQTPKGWVVQNTIKNSIKGGALVGDSVVLVTHRVGISANAGESWDFFYLGLPDSDIDAAAILPDGRRFTLLVVQSGDIWSRTFLIESSRARPQDDWGRVLHDENRAYTTISASASSEDAWAAGRGVVARSEDFGKTWATVLRRDDYVEFKSIAVDAKDLQTAFVGAPGVLVVTRDGGDSWSCTQFMATACRQYGTRYSGYSSDWNYFGRQLFDPSSSSEPASPETTEPAVSDTDKLPPEVVRATPADVRRVFVGPLGEAMSECYGLFGNVAYTKVRELWQTVATRDPVTQAFVGYWLTTSGCGLKWDEVKGKALIANATAAVEEQAQKGNVLAESLVGRLVNNGLIKPAVAVDAVTWYRRAAIHGDPSAMRIMSSLDDELGAAWLFEAAELGDVTALVFLGDRHLDGGRGVTRDRSRARDYYQRAADKSEPLGLTGLGGMYERGDLFAKSIPQAIKLYRQAADLGEDGAMVRLGLLLQKDNPREAVDWFRKSADEFGNTGGMFRLGQAYEAGTGVTKDDKVAVDWYQRAARRNHKEAQARLTALNLKW